MHLFGLLFCFSRQTKQMPSFVFWENLRAPKRLSVLSDLYLLYQADQKYEHSKGSPKMTFKIKRITNLCLEAAEKFITRKMDITLLPPHSCNFDLPSTTHIKSNQNGKKITNLSFSWLPTPILDQTFEVDLGESFIGHYVQCLRCK